MNQKHLFSILLLTLSLLMSACGPSIEQPAAVTATSSTATSTQTPVSTNTPTPPPTPAEPADIIFHNGTIITIEENQPLAEAIAVRNGLIQAVGTDEEILTLQGPDTIIIDLHGQTLMPGFIDGHTHILAFPDRMGRSLDNAQDTALRYGFTTVNEMWADQGYLDTLMRADQERSLRLRVNVFASYNDGILDTNRRKIILKTWYPEHDPILDPEQHLRIPGIKIFVDGDNTPGRGCWALSEPFTPGAPILNRGICGTTRGDLYWSQEELNQVVLQAQTAGYRVAFHAMGDRAIETALNAIEYALDGQSNGNYRHQIEHNSLARPDQLSRYEALDVVVSVRGYGDFCDLNFLLPAFGPDRYTWYANRYALPGLGIHAYIETDFGWTVDPDDRFSQRSLDPIMQLFGIVTHRFVSEDGSICEPDPLATAHAISVERALQMLTIEPAYAVSMEDYIGSLKPGKYADLIILSGNPLSVEASRLKDLKVWMTMIAGKVEYCAAGRESLCPEPQAVTPTPAANLQTTGNLALNQSTKSSKSHNDNPSRMAVDGNESTYWGAGDFAPQWIEVDLGAPATVTEIRLQESQSPSGKTVHRILVRSANGDFSEVHRFEQFTSDGDWLIFKPATPLENIQIVHIETLDSPSWVSWFEIQIFGER